MSKKPFETKITDVTDVNVSRDPAADDKATENEAKESEIRTKDQAGESHNPTFPYQTKQEADEASQAIHLNRTQPPPRDGTTANRDPEMDRPKPDSIPTRRLNAELEAGKAALDKRANSRESENDAHRRKELERNADTGYDNIEAAKRANEAEEKKREADKKENKNK